MNLEFLRAKIDEKFDSMGKFAEAIEVNRVTVSNWVRNIHEPESYRLLDIADALELTPSEVDTLMGIPSVSVVFRKIGRTPSDESVRATSEQIADTFFKIDSSDYPVRTNIYPISGAPQPLEVANQIRTFLGIKNNEPVVLNEVFVELKRHNIAVYFIPFKKLNIALPENTSNHREVAFSAFKGDRKFIFLDTERTKDGVTFDICHELAHILLDHRETTDEEEELCNAVAQELMVPAALVRENEDIFRPFLDPMVPWVKMVSRFNQLYSEYDWSPKGLALALSNNGYFTKNSHQFRRLMKFDFTWRKRLKTIDQQYFSDLDVSNYESLERFFSEIIYSNKDIYKPFWEIKEAALDGRLSYRRIASLLNIDSGDAEELIRSWEDEVGTEDTELEQEEQA